MTITSLKEKCCGCQACVQICPRGCVSLKIDAGGFWYPEIDENNCVHCDLCKNACPELNSMREQGTTPIAYAAYNLDENVRMKSSSGGFFSLLAEYVLKQDGVVYGAAMDGRKVRHIRATNMEEIALLRGSKYVQSDIGCSYIYTKEDLERKKIVLFTGTPCQIEGLKSFLRKEYTNLICMDIICHGVPSPMVWEQYIAFREKTAGASAEQIFFRNKEYGWKTFSMLFEFSNKTTYIKCFHEDLFMQTFLRNLCLRPSCYQCSFKKINRISDITVADFWGIENICPELDDNKGTSLVLVHSNRGKQIFAEINKRLQWKQVNFDEAIRGNRSMIQSAAKPKLQSKFVKRIPKAPFDRVAVKYLREPRTAKVVVKAIIKRLGLLKVIKKMFYK